MKNEMLKVLVGLQKQGIHIHLTDDGWKTFVGMLSELPDETSTYELGDDESEALTAV